MYLVDTENKIAHGPFNGDYTVSIAALENGLVHFEVWHIPSANCVLTVLAEHATMEADLDSAGFEGFTQSHLGPEAKRSS